MTNISINPDIFTISLGKTILITGSARGIGAATAKKFHSHGANTVLVDLPIFQPIAETLIRDELTTDRAVFFGADITDWNSLQGCFKSAIERFGGIDVVVINAGIMESKSVFDFEVDGESGDLIEEKEGGRVFDVNLRGTLNSELSYFSLIS